MKLKLFNTIVIFVLILSNISAQDFLVKAKKQIYSGITYSTSGINPFWLRSNVYGTVPLESNYFTLGGQINDDYDSTYTIAKKLKKFNWGYGVDVLTNLGSENRFYLPEIYGKIRYGAFEFYLGKRKEIFGLVDSSLSSGSFSWSGNAMPLPKIQLSIPNYIRLDRQGLFSIKGGYAHGYFDNNRPYTKNIKLHQKWMYLKLGKPNWKINLFSGFNHQVMWGGQSPFYSNNGQLPDGIGVYKFVVFGTRGAISDSVTSNFDENRVGNHLGTLDIGATLKTRFGTIDIYRQSFYEDGSLFYLLNINDGLKGISIKTNIKFLKKICFEYLNTSNQGGNVFIINNEYLRGADSYYSNEQYNDGYTNNGQIIGTPFIQLEALNFSNQKKNSDFFVNNNRLKLIHLGVEGQAKEIGYMLKVSFCKNFGIYKGAFSKNQFSLANLLQYHFNKNKFVSLISINNAIDLGNYYPVSFGTTLKLKKIF